MTLLPHLARTALAAAALAAGLSAAMAQALPPLPKAIQAAGVLRAGVRCDQPPYGYKDESGNFSGIETDMAVQIAAWAFGSADKIELTCVTAENRIPQLMGKKVDILLATLGVTPERARVIDFSKPYRWGGSDMLVPKDSPIRKLDDVAGKTVVMLKGSTQAKWFEDTMPKVETLRLNTASDALQALKQGRGDASACAGSHDHHVAVERGVRLDRMDGKRRESVGRLGEGPRVARGAPRGMGAVADGPSVERDLDETLEGLEPGALEREPGMRPAAQHGEAALRGQPVEGSEPPAQEQVGGRLAQHAEQQVEPRPRVGVLDKPDELLDAVDGARLGGAQREEPGGVVGALDARDERLAHRGEHGAQHAADQR